SHPRPIRCESATVCRPAGRFEDPIGGAAKPGGIAMSEKVTTDCCVFGGGPAGSVMGLLRARAGVRVTVLEKHADFLRDFRGDTIHPSTLEVMSELGLLNEFLKLPHQEVRELGGKVGGETVMVGDFT